MSFWRNLLGNQLVWLCAVIGAGQQRAWPGVVAAAVYVGVELYCSRRRRSDLRLILLAVGCGLLIDTAMAASGWIRYAAPGPLAPFAPLWILALWAAFAMTLNGSFMRLQQHHWLVLPLGLLGAPLAYLAAARGWASVAFDEPRWLALLLLGLAWVAALLLLSLCAARWSGKPADASQWSRA